MSCVFEAGSFASYTANRNVTTAFAAKKGFIHGQPSEETRKSLRSAFLRVTNIPEIFMG